MCDNVFNCPNCGHAYPVAPNLAGKAAGVAKSASTYFGSLCSPRHRSRLRGPRRWGRPHPSRLTRPATMLRYPRRLVRPVTL